MVSASGKIKELRRSHANYYAEDLGNGVMMDMVAIPGGTFFMGSAETEAERDSDEGPRHQVAVHPFSLGKYVVTQAQWRAIANFPKVVRDFNPDAGWD